MSAAATSMGLSGSLEVDRAETDCGEMGRPGIDPTQNDSAQIDQISELDEQRAEVRRLRPSVGWNAENFAREQIRGLVRQVFFANAAPAMRQVVFSPIDPETDVRRICRRVGEALALETAASVALAGEYPQLYEASVRDECAAEDDIRGVATLRQSATRLRGNLWLVPFERGGEDAFSTVSLYSHLCELRREFEYSIVEGALAGASNEATAMAQLADGVVLVLSAHRTRRATARNVKERLEAAQARILGIVLSDREFPIPEKIYRRL